MLVSMTSNYFNCLKSYLNVRLCFATKTKLSLPPLPFSSLSLHITAKTADPDGVTNSKVQALLSLLGQCSTMKDVKQIHAYVIRTGFDQNLFVMGKIVVFCAVAEQGSMGYAESVFEEIENPDGFLWNTMIRGFVRTGHVENCFEYYKRMQERRWVADNFTFSFLLKMGGQLGSVMLGRQLHCNALKHGLETHVFVRNTLIHMYGMLRDIVTARLLFEEIPRSDVVAWNTIIDCHFNCGEYKQALELFSRLLQAGIVPDEATLVVTLSACSALGALHFGRCVHSIVNHSSLIDIVSVSNALIDMYAKCGALEEAHWAFNRMKKRNIVSWNTMILGLAMHGHAHEALQLFSKMLEAKIESPNDVTFLGVLCACSHGGLVEEGRRYFNSMSKDHHVQPTIKHYGCMVDILGRAGFVEEAYGLITSMPVERNAIVWRTLLAACRLHGKIDLGEQVRRRLLDLEPDHSSDYVLLANMYATVGQWNNTVTVRKLMKDRRVQKPKPGNSIVGDVSGRLVMEKENIKIPLIEQ